MREREAIFSDFVSDLRRKEKEEKSAQKEKVCSLHCLRFVIHTQKLQRYFYSLYVLSPHTTVTYTSIRGKVNDLDYGKS